MRTGRSLEGLDLRAAIAGKQFGWDACLGVLMNHSPGSPHCFIAGAKAGDAGGLCHVTREQHAFVQYLNSFLTQLFPRQTWSSFCVSRNEFARVHQDLNAEGSLNHTVSLGPFHGGQLWICRASVDEDLVPPPDSQANQSLRGFLVNTRRSPFSFDGREAHCSQPWSGDRWVITAYTTSTWQNSSPEDVMMLRELCFPLPAPGSVSCYSALPEPPMPVDLGQVRGNLFLDLCAGVDRPLSAALLKRGVSVLSIDVLLDEKHDLLSDAVYERLLRLAFSGAVVLAHASPPSSECGSSGLRVDSGSQVINPQGCPQRDQLTPGRELLVRCAQLVLAVYTAGGHSTLLQLATALAWEAPEVQAFLKAINADLVCVPACAFGCASHRQWACASSWRALQQLASSCDHGQRAQGSSSYQTGAVPELLAEAYAQAVLPIFRPSSQPQDLSATQIPLVLPCKEKNAFPRANQDGGGIFSYPDWSVPPPGANDVFRDVRHALTKLLLELRAPARLRKHVADKSELPLFTASEVQCIRDLFQSWMLDQRPNAKFDWSVPDFQPYCLSALACLSEVLGDKDIFLFQSLLEGIPTGFAADIPKSHVFVPCGANGDDAPDDELSICDRNWKGAEDNPEQTRALLQKELDEGWLEEVPLEEARQRWSHVAVGKLSVVFSALRKPRLIVDSSVCGTNCLYHPREVQPTHPNRRAKIVSPTGEPVRAWGFLAGHQGCPQNCKNKGIRAGAGRSAA